jgi:hypothetical protein
VKYVSEPVRHRKIAIGLWIFNFTLLLTVGAIGIWSNFFIPDIFTSVVNWFWVVVVIAFVLTVLSLALNGWKPLLKK